jgi:hypothetical protein
MWKKLSSLYAHIIPPYCGIKKGKAIPVTDRECP